MEELVICVNSFCEICASPDDDLNVNPPLEVVQQSEYNLSFKQCKALPLSGRCKQSGRVGNTS